MGGTQALVFVFVLLTLLSDSTVCQMDSDIKFQAKTNISLKMIRPKSFPLTHI